MIDRPDTPHADVLLEGIWEDEVTPDDLASRALSAAQASSYAFRVASEGTTATAQLAEVDVSDFLESETGKWAQSFIGIVRVGESLVHVSHALGELARSLQQVNLEQSEIVYQVEAEIEAAQRQSAQAGVDPAARIAELIAGARARAAEVAEKMVTPETASTTKKPAAGLVSGFMAFGRVPGASAEATERNGRVARNGHARNGYAIRNTRTGQNGHDTAAEQDVVHDTVDEQAGTNGHDAAAGERATEKDAAAAAQDAFANSGHESTMDLGFMAFGRTPGSSAPPAEATPSVEDTPVADEPVADARTETVVDEPVPDSEAHTDAGTPVATNGFLGLGRAPSVGVSADDAAVPVVPQPQVNGFLAFGRTPGGAGEPAVQGPSSGPIPVVGPTQFLPIPTTPAEIVAGDMGAEFGTPMTLSGAVDGPSTDRDGRADAMDEGFLSFGRVPGGVRGGAGAPPTVPTGPEAAPIGLGGGEPAVADDEPVAEVEEPAVNDVEDEVATFEIDEATSAADGDGADLTADVPGDDVADADDVAAAEAGEDDDLDEVVDVDDLLAEDDPAGDVVSEDEPADGEVDFADELDAEADDLLARDELDEALVVEAEPDLEDPADEAVTEPENDATAIESEADDSEAGERPVDEADVDDADADGSGVAEATVEESEVAEGADAEDLDEVDIDELDDAVVEEPIAEAAEAPVDESAEGSVDDAELEVEAVAEDEPDDAVVDEPATAAPAVADVAPEHEDAAPAEKSAVAAPRQVRKSGPVKFSDLLKAASANNVSPAQLAPAALVAAKEIAAATAQVELGATPPDAPAAPDEAPSATVDPADAPEAPARSAPVLATGPAILGRTEPLVLRKKVSPVVQQVHDAVASILGSLRGGPHGPESGLHWAAGLLVKDAETIMAVTTSDAGWLPPGVLIPAGARVLWNVPAGYRWAAIDDPVRQLIEYAEQDGYTLTAVATTHPSRAYAPVLGEDDIVGVLRPGAVLPGGRSRFEATVSPARLQHIRSLDREQAERQARALIRDLETQPIAPEHAIGIEAARIDARCFLDERDEVPPAVLKQLHADERALGDALALDRTPASAEDLTAPAPDAARLRDRMLERAILVATLAAAYHDIESAVYAWTYARFLASQDQDSKQAR